jgi:hypothetical protein
MRGFPRPCIASRFSGGIQVKGAGPFDRVVHDLRSGSQEKSCGVGLRGFESHPPHYYPVCWSEFRIVQRVVTP